MRYNYSNWGYVRNRNSLNIEEEQEFLDFCKEKGLPVGDNPYDGTWDVELEILKAAYEEWAELTGAYLAGWGF